MIKKELDALIDSPQDKQEFRTGIYSMKINFNLQDTELFLDSLAIRGQDIVDNYEQLQDGEIIDNGPLDISSLVGKTIERDKFPRNKKMIPMRKIEL